MKAILATFNASVSGVATLSNTQAGSHGTNTNTFQDIKLSNNNIAMNATVQTIFSGTPPTYTIEANLGMLDTVQGSPTFQQNIIDPNGWGTLLNSNIGPNQNTPIIAPIQAVIYAIRMNITTPGTGTGVLKLLQQGIQ